MGGVTWLLHRAVYLTTLAALIISTVLWVSEKGTLSPEALRVTLQPDLRTEVMRWYLAERQHGLQVDLTKTGACVRRVIARHAPANLYDQCPWVGRDEGGVFVMEAVSSLKCYILDMPD